MEDCPIPAVAEALRPYIKPRDEVARIRNGLQDHLKNQLRPKDSPLSSTQLLEVTPGLISPEAKSTITGVRKAYLRALQAHSAAQAKYDALKADIAKLSTPTAKDVSSGSKSTVRENFIPLLSQREKQRKLQVLDKAFSDIVTAGKPALDSHLDDIVKRQAGDLPTPPTAPPPSFGDKPDAETRILQLKKAVLATKRVVDSHSAANGTNGDYKPGSGAEVAGLQAALNELTGWMEHQLAIIGDAETEPPPTPGQANGHETPDSVNMETIERLYEDYVAARQRLVQTISDQPSSKSDNASDRSASPVEVRSRPATQRSSPAGTLLPFIDQLRAMQQQEQTLLHQTSHLRRQITGSESETQRLMARLADESHLVQPGASRGRDWAGAGREAARETQEFVEARLEAGEASADAAEKVLSDVRGVPDMLDGLADGKGRGR